MRPLIPLAMFIAISTPAFAVDGVLEINQPCAVGPGCFTGDAPGLPVTIVYSGSYRLTGNLTQVDDSRDVIQVGSVDKFAPVNGVTIDLNGFSIVGSTICTPVGFFPPTAVTCVPGTNSGSGIVADGDNITVRNGSVIGIAGVGIALNGINHLVQAVSVTSVRGPGISVGGASIVADCAVSRNGFIGISNGSALGTTVIRNNVVSFNGLSGISVQSGVVADNTVHNNVSDGIRCTTCTVINNQVNSSGGVGISLSSGSVIGNTVYRNVGFAMHFEAFCPSTCDVGYSQNIVTSIAGGTTNTVSGGVQTGANVCNNDTICP